MAHWLSKKLWLLAICSLISEAGSAQATSAATDHGDYKDAKSHERFYKRRNAVSAWQIKNLKENGALVVRLKTNQMVIDELQKRGETHLAEKSRLEQAGININIIRAFLNNYTFSKVYFIYSNSSDSLLRGARSGIFVDSSLNVNAAITMKEKFYLIAEPDYVYNSSIGFVPEDSARFVIEAGNPSATEYPFVIKNKYGHQLKAPFPFAANKAAFIRRISTAEIAVQGQRYVYNVTGGLGLSKSGGPEAKTYTKDGKTFNLSLRREMTYDALSQNVEDLNTSLNDFYRSHEPLKENSTAYEDAKPFFY